MLGVSFFCSYTWGKKSLSSTLSQKKNSKGNPFSIETILEEPIFLRVHKVAVGLWVIIILQIRIQTFQSQLAEFQSILKYIQQRKNNHHTISYRHPFSVQILLNFLSHSHPTKQVDSWPIWSHGREVIGNVYSAHHTIKQCL